MNLFGRHHDERGIVLKTAIREGVGRIGQASLERWGAAAAIGDCQVDEPAVAELLVGGVADIGDAVGVEDDAIAGAERDAALVVGPSGNTPRTAPPVPRRSTAPSARIRMGG